MAKDGILKYGQWTLKDVGRHWDETTHYDDINERTYSYFRRFVDGYRMATKEKLRQGIKVLDISCRTGKGSAYFNEKQPGMKFVGMDLTKFMLKLYNEVMGKTKAKFETRYFDTYDLPGKDAEFDYVLFFETMEHVPKPDVFLKEIARMMKPGAEMILTTPNIGWEFVHWFAAITHIHHSEGPHRFLSRAEIIRHIRNAGLKIKKEETTVFIPYGPGFVTRSGELFEKWFKHTLMPLFGLRRIFICEKI